MQKKYIILLVILLIAAAMAFKLASNKKKIDEQNKPVTVGRLIIPVKVTAAKEQTLEINILKTGNITPFKEVKALALTGGTLTAVRFRLGDKVSAGQVLAVTDARGALLDLQKAEAGAAKLKNELETYTELLQGKAATQEKVNDLRGQYDDAVNQVNVARKNIADLSVKAPAGGVVSVKSVEEGMYINGGGEIATIVDLSKPKVQVNLTEREVYRVTVGQSVRITADVYPGKVFTGVVSFISPQADQAHNYLTEILIDNPRDCILRSGTFVYADFSKKTSGQVLVIPREALTGSVKDASVYVVNGNVVHLMPIQTAGEIGDQIRVSAGLHPGDTVVVSGQINIKEGSIVSISQ